MHNQLTGDQCCVCRMQFSVNSQGPHPVCGLFFVLFPHSQKAHSAITCLYSCRCRQHPSAVCEWNQGGCTAISALFWLGVIDVLMVLQHPPHPAGYMRWLRVYLSHMYNNGLSRLVVVAVLCAGCQPGPPGSPHQHQH